MKKNILYLILIIGLISCIKDTGNYEYNEVNSVTVELGEVQDYVYQYETLVITPKFTQTLRESKSNINLECLWILEGLVGAKLKDTISRDTICNSQILLPPGNYKGTLYVTDSDTKLFYKSSFNIRINSNIGQGLLVLNETVEKEAKLTYIKFDYGTEHTVLTEVYLNTNKSSLGVNPKSLYIMWPGANSGDFEKLLINCDDEDGGKVVDLYTFEKISPLKDYFWLPPEPMQAVDAIFNVSQLSLPPSAAVYYYSVVQGKLYGASSYRNIMFPAVGDIIKIDGEAVMRFRPPATPSTDKTMFPKLPYLDGKVVGHGYTTPAFWDKENHCFTFTSDRLTLNKCYYNAATNVGNLHFDPINLPGYDLLATGPFYRGGEDRTVGNSYAIVRETATNKYYCLLIVKKSNNELLPKDPYKIEIVDNNSQTPPIDGNSLFLGSLFTYDLYFAIGNKLYRKGLTSILPTPPAELMWEAPAGTTITSLHGEALYDNEFAYMGMSTTRDVNGFEIFIAVFDPAFSGENKGSVYRFKTTEMGQTPVEVKEGGWPKLNCAEKIVSMLYKGN